jgi:hypothetical protein
LKTLLASAALVGTLGTVAHAEASAENVAALVAAIEANGCVISEANAVTILGASGLTDVDAGVALDALGEAGEADGATVKLTRNDDGTVTLTSPGCPG